MAVSRAADDPEHASIQTPVIVELYREAHAGA